MTDWSSAPQRPRRAAQKIKAENPLFSGDTGFRVFKLAPSNIRAWRPDRNNLAASLLDYTDNLTDSANDQNILYEMLLKLGLDLTVPIETRSYSGKTVYSVGYGALMACLPDSISREDVEGLAQGIIAWHTELNPAGGTQLIFRDSAFADNVAKTNMTAILEQHGLRNVRSI